MKGVRVTFGVGGVLNSRSWVRSCAQFLPSSKLQVPVFEIDTGDYGHAHQEHGFLKFHLPDQCR